MMKIKEVVEEIRNNPVEAKGHIYHRIPFPEFDGLTTSSKQKGVNKKWEMIVQYSKQLFGKSLKGRRVLDVGSNAGFYTFNFANEGSVVKSYELHDRYSIYGKVISEEKKVDVEWLPEAFTSKSLNEDEHFDIALLLSVFQWMAAGDINDKESRKSLHSISTHSDYLFFELGFNKGKSCVRTNKFNHYAEMIRFLREVTAYKFFKLVTKTRIWGGHSRYLVICSNNQEMDDIGIRRLIRSANI